jgi:flagellar motility protein MotE (MotC chaperone)
MKKILPFLIIFALAAAAAGVAVGVVFYTRPELITGVPPPVADSAAVEVHGRDSLKSAHVTPDSTVAKDSTQVAVAQSVSPADSLARALAEERVRSASLAEQLRSVKDSTRVIIAAADSAKGVQRASMAKVLEAMDPVSAARILTDFPDGDVKQIILTIKKKQAAKILAALQPDRAARIMR